ncbi:hypothetical protein [Clostridium tyrobutyricum]|jgi:hypothetical protein|uniref:hypothetical protein n=1 Tax=Clostridium tyrobutyricum TaxID=1519 RepID=UPI0010AA67CB|nr:hypothetical protein [Clostridium tyrobutyricum]MBV4427114.1 hypothetical protein [Clostridium tyrobutyricum]MBV4440142.1 hypothetical protein [Clostridium tyrobutyricum]MBV4442159.1 hypothetical protein [Clostridium tyrobutyricum]MBV4442270.1 hypothetical protein [Clostridium tyrobutyricum]MBV4445342.1 hypothetical protein [Clostridium tyrobutyricum]
MDYKNVLETQITRLEKIQGHLILRISNEKESAVYTERALNVIANTSSRIRDIVSTLLEMEHEPSLNLLSNGQNEKE